MLLSIGTFYYLNLYSKKLVEKSNDDEITQEIYSFCLEKDEFADYPIDGRYAKEIKMPQIPLIVYIKDRDTNEIKHNFRIDNVREGQSSIIELHTCGVYVIRMFNYNPKKSNQDPGFRVELWKYQYSGSGNSILLLAEKDKNGIYKGDYSYDFDVDFWEKTLVLIKSYLGKDDYSLVIKDINTKEDILSIKLNDITKKYPNVIGSIGLIKWTDDGRYFWADIFDGAYTKGFIRVDSKDWSYQIFEMPGDMDIGVSGPLNFNTGYTLLYPGLVWTGVVEVDQQLRNELLKEGKQSIIYLYNIFTKQRELIATTTKPLWDFNGQWLSDTELQYTLPSGEKRIYKIEK